MTARDLLTEAAEHSPRVRAWCRWTGARTEADLERCTPRELAELDAILADPDRPDPLVASAALAASVRAWAHDVGATSIYDLEAASDEALDRLGAILDWRTHALDEQHRHG